jgi:hypothetical protein
VYSQDNNSIKLSNNTLSFRSEVSVDGDNVFVAWVDDDDKNKKNNLYNYIDY